MPTFRPIGVVRVTDTHNAYGFMEQPGFQGTDSLVGLGFTNTYDSENIRCDMVARCVCTEPIFVPHHNLRSKYDRVGWVTMGDGEQLPELTPVILNEEELREGLPDYGD